MKKFNRIASVFLVISMLFSMCVIPANAFSTNNGNDLLSEPFTSNISNSVNDSGVCGDDLTWNISSNILTISGTGNMYDYEWHVNSELMEYLDTPWYSMREEIIAIYIEEGVTSIGENAFADCFNVLDITIPDSVSSIGTGAFDGCYIMDNQSSFNTTPSVNIDNTSENVRYSVLVLDVSGSMGSKPMAAQKAAAIKFCESILAVDGKSYVAIISFASSVKVVSDFTDSIDVLSAAINRMSSSGSTNTIGALNKADELLSAIPDTAGRSVVLCSDGLPNLGTTTTQGPFTSSDNSSYYRYANAVHNKSVELMQKYDVFSLGFFHSLSGSNLEFARKFTESIQSAGYYEVTNPDDLEFTFGDIADDVVTPGHSGIFIVNVPSEKYIIHVVDEDGENLRGVTVTCNNKSAITNTQGIAQFDKSLFVSTPTITATATGYQDWTNEKSNWEMSSNGYATIKMYTTTSSKYKLDECTYSNVSGYTPGVNLLAWTKTVSLGNDLPVAGDLDFGHFYLKCKAIETAGIIKYELWQGNNRITECADGNFGKLSIDKLPFSQGSGCFIRVITDTGETVDTNINLQFKKHAVNEECLQISFAGSGKPGEDSSLSFKVGDNVPFIGGSNFKFQLPPSAPITVLFDPEGKIQVGVNLNDMLSDDRSDRQKTLDEAKKFLTDVRTAENLKLGKLDNAQKKTFYKLLGNMDNNKDWQFFKGGELNFLGYFEGDHSSKTLKGHVMLQGTIKAAEFGFTTWVVVVPVTVQVRLDLEGNLIGELGYDWENAQFIGSLDFDASAKLTAFGGIGVGKAIGAGAYGSATLNGNIRLIGSPWGLRSVDLTGELGAKAYLAWFEYERPFAYNTWHLYSGNNVRMFPLNQAETPVMMSMYNADNYHIHDLDYLADESEWIGYPTTTFAASASTNLSPLQLNTYRNAKPVMISAGNALYASFLKADIVSGDVYAVVTKYDSDYWCEPVRIDDASVMDSTPNLCVDDNGVIWLAYAKTSNDADKTSMLDYARKQTIVVGTVNPDTLSFTVMKEYTGVGYAHMHSLSIVDGIPTLVWVDSEVTTADSVLWTDGTSELYLASYSSESGWNSAEKFVSIDKPIMQIAAGKHNNKAAIAYVVDEDTDSTTEEDHTLYIATLDSSDLITDNVLGKVSYGTLPDRIEADFMWNDCDTLVTVSGANISAVGITNTYKICGNRIYYSSAADEGAHLSTVIYDDNTWSVPVTLTGGNRYLENISVVELMGNHYVMGMNTKAEITDTVEDEKNLVWGTINPTSDLVLDGITYDADTLTVGNNVPITLTVLNAGDHIVNSVDVYVDNQYYDTFATAIKPGDSDELTVNISCPSTLIEYNFSVNETQESDYSPENNIGKIGIGYSDLEITVAEERIENNSSLVVFLTNKGIANASGTINVGSELGVQLKETKFTDLAAGETLIVHYSVQEDGVYTAAASLENDTVDLYQYNNSDTIRIGTVPELPKYNIVFDANDGTGTVVESSVLESGSELTITEQDNLVRDGYELTGWNTEADGTGITYSKGDKLIVTDNITLYAQWKVAESIITYNVNDGSGTVTTNTVRKGEDYTLANAPTRRGYTFTGWNTKADGTGTTYYAGVTLCIEDDLELFAQWVSANTEVDWVTVDGVYAVGNDTEFVVVLPYTTEMLPTSPYTIQIGLSDSGAEISDLITFDAGEMWTFTVIAADGVTRNTYTISVSIAEDLVAENNAVLEALKQTLKHHNWTVTQETANDADSVKAWIAQQMDGMALNGASYTVEIQDVVPAQAGVLSDLDGTNGSFAFTVKLIKGSGETYAETTVSMTGTITATVYTPINYTVTYNANGGMGSVASATVTEGASYTIAGQGDLVRDGFTFVGWNTAVDGTGESYAANASVTITGNLTLYAQWGLANVGVDWVTVDGVYATRNDTEFVVILPYTTEQLPTSAESIRIGTSDSNAAISMPVTSDMGKTWNFTVTARDSEAHETYTISVRIAENPAAGNLAALEALKQTLECHNWTVAQATANDANSVKAWIAQQMGGMALNGASYIVEIQDVVPAQAGALSDLDGTNGSFAFTVKLTKGSGETYAETTVSMTGTITATFFAPVNYTVTYNANGGMGSVASATVTEGTGYTIAGQGNLVRYGYTFVGWNTMADGTGESYAAGANVTITRDLTLYAQWRFIDDGYYPPVIPNIPTPEKPSTPETPTETPWVNPYADVAEDAWYYEAVKFVSENGIMNGIAIDTFAPNATTTRAMVWTMLARLSGIDTEGGASWYEKGLAWAMENGISDGTNATGEITREQLVVMLWRFSGSPKPLDSSLAALSGYTDSDSISGYAQQAMAWAIGNGIISGTGDGILNSGGNATRAQVATILWRFCEKIQNN